MKRKIINLILIIVMFSGTLFMMTGCGKTEKNGDSGNASSRNNLASKVKVGDYISYNAGSNKYTLTAEKSGTNSNQEIESTGKEKWRVLSIEDDGTVNIVSEDGIGTKYDKGISFDGKEGYNNIVEELNNMCKIFGSGEYAVSARSMTMSDFNKFLDVDSVVEYYENKFEKEVTGNTTEEKFESIYKLINEYYKQEMSIGGEKVLVNTGYFDWEQMGLNYGVAKCITNETYSSLLKNDNTIFLANQIVKYSMSSNKENVFCKYNIASYYYGTNTASYNSGITLYAITAKATGEVFSTSDDTNHNYENGYIRPVVSLAKDLTATSGSGTESDPYVLSK